MKKRFVSLITALAVILALIPQITLTVSAAEEAEFAGGSGTEGNPYQISTAEQLQSFAYSVNSGMDYTGQYIKLTADIDLSSVCGAGNPWMPIGNYGYTYGPWSVNQQFTGIFDGDNHTVSGLYLSTGGYYTYNGGRFSFYSNVYGLFGRSSGTIKNLAVNGYASNSTSDNTGVIVGENSGTLENCRNTGDVPKGSGVVYTNSGTVTECYNTGTVNNGGGVVGTNNSGGTVENCYNTGTVNNGGGVVRNNSGGTIENCYNNGNITNNNYLYAGGVVSDNRGAVTGCYNTGNITNTGNYSSGGIVGNSSGTVSNSYNTGTVDGSAGNIGGIAGISSGTVALCFNAGAVSKNSSNYNGSTGGIVGNNNSTITNCFNVGAVSSDIENYTGGIAGYNYRTIENCYNSGSVTGYGVAGNGTVTSSFYLEGTSSRTDYRATQLSAGELRYENTFTDAGWDFGSIWTMDEIVGRPVLQSLADSLGIVIGSKTDLENFRYYMNNNSYSDSSGMTVNLAADIDLEGSDDNLWTPICDSGYGFRGVFRGNGHTISGLYNNPLFGTLAGAVSDLAVSNASEREGSVTIIPLIAQYNKGKIQGCTADGDSVGSLVENNINGGTIKNCYVPDGYGHLSIVEYNSGTLENCYSMNVSIVGTNSGRILNSYSTSGSDATKLTESEFGNQTTFEDAGWDFNSVWKMHKILMRPIFQYQNDILEEYSEDVYLIKTFDELESVRKYARGHDCEGITFRLAANIDLSASYNADNDKSWTPIGSESLPFKGTFDGRYNNINHSIIGLYINGDNDYQGLFGYVDEKGTVENLTVKGSVTGKGYIAGVAGYNKGTVDGCNSYVTVTGNDNYAGGLTGYNTGTLSNGKNRGAVKGKDYVGGAAGYSTGTVSSCDNYTGGSVTGKTYVGGSVGYNNAGKVSGYNNGTVTGTGNYVGGSVGYNNSGEVNGGNNGTVTGTGDYIGGSVGYNNAGTLSGSSSGTITGTGNYVGGVVGYNDNGTVSGVRKIGTNGTEYCIAGGTIQGKDCVGGVAGYNTGSVSLYSYLSDGSVSGDSYVGGIVGDNRGAVVNNYSKGTVSGSNYVGGIAGSNNDAESLVSSSYSIGTVTGTSNAGGIAGNNIGTVTDTYYKKDTASGGINGTDTEGSVVKSADAFTSGEVTWLLQQPNGETRVWGQKISDDEYPILIPSSGNKVYKVTFNSGITPLYTNGTVTAPSPDPTKANSVFKYWSTSETAPSGEDKENEFDFANKITADTSLYAIFVREFGERDTETLSDTVSIAYKTEITDIDLTDYIEFADSSLGTSGQFAFALKDGSELPTGLTLTDGVISGTPTDDIGNYSVTFTVKDKSPFISLMSLEPVTATEEAELTLVFNITQAENSWTTEPSITEWNYGSSANEPEGEARFGTVSVTYSGEANDGTAYIESSDAPTEAGDYTATFTVAGTDNYSGISKGIDFTIGKKDITVSITPNGGTYGNVTAATAEPVGFVEGHKPSVTLTYTGNEYNSTAAPENPGTYTVTATVADTNYNLTGTTTAEFVIDKAEAPGITVPTLSAVTYSPERTLNDIELSGDWKWTDGSTVPTAANSGYTAYITVDDAHYDYTGDEGYDSTNHRISRTISLTVNKATVTAPTISSKTYNGTNQTATVTESSLYIVTENDGGTNAGNYDVKLTLADSINYKWTDSDASVKTLQFEITKASDNAWTTEPSISDWTYNETASSPVSTAKYGTATVSYTGTTNGGESYNSGTLPTDAGSYTATFTIAENDSYNGLTKAVNFTVSKATQNISTPTASSTTFTSVTLNSQSGQGTTEYAWSANITAAPTNWQTGTTFSGLTQGETYYFFARFNGNNNYEAAISESRAIVTENHTHHWIYTVNNGVITATCDGAGNCSLDNNGGSVTLAAPASNLVYDGTSSHNATVTGEFTTGAVVSAITYEYKSTQNGNYAPAANTVNAGYYKASVTAGGSTASVEYTVAKSEVAAPTISSKTYNGTNQTATVTESSLYIVTENDGGTNAGNYDVKLTLADSINYKWTDSDASVKTLQFEITKASDNAWTTEPSISDWTYNETASSPVSTAKYGTATVSYTGTTNGGESYNSGTLPTDAGSYTATFTIAENDSYNGLTKAVNFTVSKATQNISAPTAASTTLTSVTLAEQAGQGTIEYAYNTENTAPELGWSTNRVFTGLGQNMTYYFFTRFSGNDNYKAAKSEGRAITTADHSHDWKYTVAGTTLTATCNNTDGNCPNVDGGSITLTAPSAGLVYDGVSSHNAAVTGALTTGADVVIKYEYNASKASDYTGTNSTVNAGYYRAYVEIDSKVAEVQYEVKKAVPQYVEPSALTATFGQTLGDIETGLPSGFKWDEESGTSVGNVGTKTFTATFTPADTINYNTVSKEVTVNVLAAKEIITAAENIEPDYMEEKLGTFDNGTYLVTINGEPSEVTVTNGAIKIKEEYFGETIAITKKASDANHEDSESVSVTIDARPSAPEITSDGNTTPASDTDIADGVITGVDSTMEYRAENGNWTAVTGNTITNLYPGTYYVRTKQNGTYFAGSSTSVTVGARDKLTITFINGDGTEKTKFITYGTVPTYDTETDGTPSKASTAQYEYTFSGWDKEFAEVTENTTYTAQFTQQLRKYKIKWITDETESETELEYGTVPEYNGTPSKEPDERYSYEFDKWTPDVIEVAGEASYTALFKSIPRTYSVTLNTNGGTLTEEIHNYTYGTALILPTAEGISKDNSTFDGWYDNESLTGKAVTEIAADQTGDKTFYAKWTTKKSSKSSSKRSNASATAAPISTPTPIPATTSAPTEAEEAIKTPEPAKASESTGQYIDVPQNAWYYEPIKHVTEEGIMTGVTGNEFYPEFDISRAMFITVIYRIEGEPETEIDYTFEDIEKGIYFEKAVAWGKKNGIISGYTDKIFAPYDKVTREQMATMLWRYAKYKGIDVSLAEETNIQSYTDADTISPYAVEAFKWACGEGIINGFEDRTLRPWVGATRAQASVLFGEINDMIN